MKDIRACMSSNDDPLKNPLLGAYGVYTSPKPYSTRDWFAP